MKKIAATFFFFAFLLCTVGAQTYKLQKMDTNIETYLELYPNNEYIVKMSHRASPDFMMSNVFSFGTFTKDAAGTYVFTDKTHGFTMTMEIASKTTQEKVLFVKNAFSWMGNNYFSLTSSKAATPQNITENFLSAEELVSFRNKNKAEKRAVKIENGQYKSGLDGYVLTLNQNKTYSLHFYNMVLSKGNWNTENNLLILIDGDIKARFYGIVNSDGSIRSALFPGEFNASMFKKEQ